MASQEVTGKTPQEIAEWKFHWDKDTPFDEAICLVEIKKQPEDYEGPTRYCSQYAKNWGRCHYHGGADGSGEGNPDTSNLDKLAAMTHGLSATRANFYEYIEDSYENSEQQARWMKEMYDWIVDEWPEAYGIDLESDPASAYDFHALAVEIVRAEHAEGYILREGEKGEKEVVSPTGEIRTEDVPHYLAEMMQRQRKLIMKMENHLGISRKSRLKREDNADATDAIQDLAEIGKQLLSPEENEYDADEYA